jgi:hypothetical protein
MRSLKPLAVVALTAMLLPTVSAQSGFTGRWNFTGTGEHADRVYWLEVTEANGALSGLFLNRTGSPVVLETVKIEDGQLLFQMRGGRGDAHPNKVRLEGGKLVGTIMDRGTAIPVTGVRPPKWPASRSRCSTVPRSTRSACRTPAGPRAGRSKKARCPTRRARTT